MHNFRPWPKHLESFKGIGVKQLEGMPTQGTYYLKGEYGNRNAK